MASPKLTGRPSKDLKITKHSPGYWRATFDHLPLNLFNNNTFLALLEPVEQLETDEDVKVVVFDSANADYYIALFDLVKGFDPLPNGRTLFDVWPQFVVRFAQLPVLTIASIRGRARGVGSEFIQACDIRFASRELAIFGQPEVGAGLVLGGGGLEWLHRHVGRSRALEIVLGSEDFDATTAELYGWVNRAVADDMLDDFVDAFSRRVAGFDKKPLVTAKRLINDHAGLPSIAEMTISSTTFLECAGLPETQARGTLLNQHGLQESGDLELRLGYHVAHLGTSASTTA
jgi:enoyl-CoA hydratase/carnithine racemase